MVFSCLIFPYAFNLLQFLFKTRKVELLMISLPLSVSPFIVSITIVEIYFISIWKITVSIFQRIHHRYTHYLCLQLHNYTFVCIFSECDRCIKIKTKKKMVFIPRLEPWSFLACYLSH